jgi:hypothetical protein
MKHVLRISLLAAGVIPFVVGAVWVVALSSFESGFDWGFAALDKLFYPPEGD